MTPVDETSQSDSSPPSPELRHSADIVVAAAEALALESSEAREASRYLLAADRISTVLDSSAATRQRLLMASPAVTELSGQWRTLIEMIEAEPGDAAYRFRLAKLLFRALLWRPETFPTPPT
jgi:predicted component of type VI protein secretion system